MLNSGGVFQESLLNPSLLFSFGWKKNDCSFIFKAICATFGLLILGSPLEELREMVTSWQSKLEPLRRELQMKVSQKGALGFLDDDSWSDTKNTEVSIVSRVLVIIFSCFLVYPKDLQRSLAWGSWSDGSSVNFQVPGIWNCSSMISMILLDLNWVFPSWYILLLYT